MPGLLARLPYLADLGVDAIWITPWYRSPMADGGYDVADYRAIDPLFGTLEDAQAVIDAAPTPWASGSSWTSSRTTPPTSTRWFQAALAAPGAASAGARRYLFRDGRGPGGDEPPNNWRSMFGGPAWTRVTDDGTPGQWYLHLFAPQQPDLNWAHPAVAADFDDDAPVLVRPAASTGSASTSPSA